MMLWLFYLCGWFLACMAERMTHCNVYTVIITNQEVTFTFDIIQPYNNIYYVVYSIQW